MRSVAIVAILLMSTAVAGCATPATPPGDAVPATLPSSLDVDLHEYVVHITMPEGQPTALVMLNVTKDMWVRPFVTVYPNNMEMTPTTSPTNWVLCPWVRTFGVSAPASVGILAYWVAGDGSLAHTGALAFTDDSEEGQCAGEMSFALTVRGVTSTEPQDATLLLVVTRVPGAIEKGAAPTDPAPYSFLAGIAAKPCQGNSGRLCPPAEATNTRPLAFGGEPVYAYFVGEPSACDGCGFTVQDDRVAGRGTLTVDRVGAVQQGIADVYFQFFTSSIDASLSTEPPMVVSSTDFTGSAWFELVGGFSEPLVFHALRDTWAIQDPNGPSLVLWMLEIPVDLAAVGFHAEAFTGLYCGTPSPFSETTEGLCA